jgi:transcription elongation GreA/GreB family factor
LKPRVWEYCLDLLQGKLGGLELQLAELRAGAESEGKSSAGDKHETGRAMMHLEQEQLQKQVGELQNQLQQLLSLKNSEFKPNVHSGSLVTTDKGVFYIGIGLGKIDFEGQNLFVISPASPIGKVFMGKIKGDAFSFGPARYNILEIA